MNDNELKMKVASHMISEYTKFVTNLDEFLQKDFQNLSKDEIHAKLDSMVGKLSEDLFIEV